MLSDLKTFDDPRLFLEQVTHYLERNEAENNLLFGLLSGLIESKEPLGTPPFLGLLENDGDVAVIAVRTPLLPLVLPVVASEAGVEKLAAHLQGLGERLPGVTGPAREARIFAARWCALAGQRQRTVGASRIYRLDAVTPPRPVSGKIRAYSEADAALATQWLKEFQGDSGESEPATAVGNVFQRILGSDERRLFFWDDGRPVSMAGCSGPTPSGIRINSVYTPLSLRGRGYASACVAALSQTLLDEGRKFCFLYTDLTNETSNHIYQAVGYRRACDVEVIVFQP